MNTLVIHPYDDSTNFLCKVYEGKDYSILRSTNISKYDLMSLISGFDRIIMMGHGTPRGLIDPNYACRKRLYLIDDDFSWVLRNKECISIWCYSDEFFTRNKMGEGEFHTGMIISELGEEIAMLKEAPLDDDDMLCNMEKFAEALNQCIDKSPEKMKEYMLEHYNDNDAVTQFNRNNIKVI